MSHDNGEKKGLQYSLGDHSPRAQKGAVNAEEARPTREQHAIEALARAAAESDTLRDRFAMCALTGVLAAIPDDASWPNSRGVASYCYELAGAMLAERAKCG